VYHRFLIGIVGGIIALTRHPARKSRVTGLRDPPPWLLVRFGRMLTRFAVAAGAAFDLAGLQSPSRSAIVTKQGNHMKFAGEQAGG